MASISRAVSVVLPIVLAVAGAYGQATFQGLGFLPGIQFGRSSAAEGVSADGKVVVGVSTSDVAQEAFRWSKAEGMVGLGFYSLGKGVSGDGLVLVGDDNSEGFFWTDPDHGGQGAVEIGDLPGGFVGTLAQGISADGKTIVGLSSSGNGYEAFRWTKLKGMIGLGDLPGGMFDSSALDVSGDGSVIVGRGTYGGATEAFMWTDPAKGGAGMVGLGDLSGGASSSTAMGVSADGKTIVGQGTSASGPEAFRWTKAKGMIALGDLPGGAFWSEARAANADGSVIVGQSKIAGDPAAFIWTDPATGGAGMVRLQTLLTETYGLNLAGWTLQKASAINAAGTAIVGVGSHNGLLEAFIATIPAGGQACYPDFTGDGTLDLFDFLEFVNAFNAADPDANCDGNGSLDLFDFLCFTNAFNGGCP